MKLIVSAFYAAVTMLIGYWIFLGIIMLSLDVTQGVALLIGIFFSLILFYYMNISN